jgi:hypothetical protein
MTFLERIVSPSMSDAVGLAATPMIARTTAPIMNPASMGVNERGLNARTA